MKTIRIKQDGKLVGKFRYEVELAKGVYMTVASISVKKNMDKFKIELEKAKDGNIGVRYSKRGECVIATVNIITEGGDENTIQLMTVGVSVDYIYKISGLHIDIRSVLIGCVDHLELKKKAYNSVGLKLIK